MIILSFNIYHITLLIKYNLLTMTSHGNNTWVNQRRNVSMDSGSAGNIHSWQFPQNIKSRNLIGNNNNDFNDNNIKNNMKNKNVDLSINEIIKKFNNVDLNAS